MPTVAIMECPFCGVGTDEPHKSQEACITALHAEIGRIKGVVDCLRSTAVPTPVDLDDQAPFRAPTLRDEQEPQY